MTAIVIQLVANGLLLPALYFLLRNASGRYTDQLSNVQKRQDEHEAKVDAEMAKIREHLDNKVNDEEWLRETMGLRKKVDDQAITLATINGKLDSTLQVALAVTRVATAVEKSLEAGRGD